MLDEIFFILLPKSLSLPKRVTQKMNSNALREKSRLFYKSSVTDWFLIEFKNNQD